RSSLRRRCEGRAPPGLYMQAAVTSPGSARTVEMRAGNYLERSLRELLQCFMKLATVTPLATRPWKDLQVTLLKLSRLAAASVAAGTFLSAPLAAGAQSVQVTKMCACWVTALSADGSAATGLLNSNYATFRWTMEKGAKPLGR